jgi:thymidylate synthase
VNFHLNSVKENETDIKNEWENLQNILKSATYETLGKIKGRNRRKYLHVWNDQIKQLIEEKKK